MYDCRKQIERARAGQIIPMVQQIDIRCPVEFFARLSDYGRARHCCLLESKDYLTEGDKGELTFGTANPALYLTGTGDKFVIEALSPTGRRIVKYLAGKRERFSFCRSVEFGEEKISGQI